MVTELNWTGKKESKEFAIPSSMINKLESFSSSKTRLSHAIYEGNNLDVMLLQRKVWQSKFNCIYIDPPYNTGNNDFFYTDNFKQDQDKDRHHSWLSFMYQRLILAHEFLTEDGAIFISIDDSEVFHLKLICDEIFGEINFVANFVRKNKGGSGHDSKQVAVEYDYVLCYAKSIEKLKFKQEIVDVENDSKYKFEDKHLKKRGKYYLRDLDYRGSYSKSLDYAITTPDKTKIYAGKKIGKPNTWRWSKEKFEWGKKNGFIEFKERTQGWKVYIKQYQFVDNNDELRVRKLPYRALINFSNSKGSTELKNILDQSIFSYPKPTDLLVYLINLFDKKDIKVLDFFAGSGTTLHALMKLNKEDGGKRLGTLINNNENNICREVTYARNIKVIQGYVTRAGKKVVGLKGNTIDYFGLANG